jgi:uncharacterized membrane protein YphA (DoxX/SURF4 family)
MRILTQISRILVGVLFILSGFIKANDTIGFSYKLVEYFEVFHMPVFVDYAVPIAMLICIFEIMVGVALLMGAYSKLNAWLLLVMILFFTWLTGYSAITHKVTDCGCFGDAVKLKPVESFIKDLVLLVFIIIIFIGHKHIKPLFNNTLQSIGLSVALLVTTAFTLYTYMFLPRIDFLPYKVGNDIKALRTFPENAIRDSFNFKFVYKKDGQEIKLGIDELSKIDDTYEFVSREDVLIREGYKLQIPDFKLYNTDGIEYTDSLLADETNYKLIIIQKDIEASRGGTEAQLARLGADWQAAGYKVWAITSSPPELLEPYRHEHQLTFQYYTMDATPVKSMIRSNPGVMLWKGNVVVKKWSGYAIPSMETVKKYMK